MGDGEKGESFIESTFYLLSFSLYSFLKSLMLNSVHSTHHLPLFQMQFEFHLMHWRLFKIVEDTYQEDPSATSIYLSIKASDIHEVYVEDTYQDDPSATSIKTLYDNQYR